MPDPWSYADKTGKEHAHQASLFMWANMAMYRGLAAANDPLSYTKAGVADSYDWLGDKVPQFKWLHAIHNQGHGDAVRGSNAKAEGVKTGVYDMFLPVPTRYAGYYLELKVGKNGTSDKQDEFGRDMTAVGYLCEVAWGWLEARNKLLAYLGLPLYG